MASFNHKFNPEDNPHFAVEDFAERVKVALTIYSILTGLNILWLLSSCDKI